MQSFAFYSSLILELTPPDTVTAWALRDSTVMLPSEPRIQAFPINLTAELTNPDFHNVILDTYVARRDLLHRTRSMKEALSVLRQEINAWLEHNHR